MAEIKSKKKPKSVNFDEYLEEKLKNPEYRKKFREERERLRKSLEDKTGK